MKKRCADCDQAYQHKVELATKRPPAPGGSKEEDVTGRNEIQQRRKSVDELCDREPCNLMLVVEFAPVELSVHAAPERNPLCFEGALAPPCPCPAFHRGREEILCRCNAQETADHCSEHTRRRPKAPMVSLAASCRGRLRACTRGLCSSTRHAGLLGYDSREKGLQKRQGRNLSPEIPSLFSSSVA